MASPTEENYLKTLLSLSDGGSGVNITELSYTLGISTPSANSMIRNLDKKGLVVYQKYKPIHLTSEGRHKAALIVRRHRLTEMYLGEKMGFGWEEVHDIAEQMEHINSPIFFERMDELLGHPTLDPHGSPIPDKNGNIDHQEFKSLTNFEVGTSVILCGLSLTSTEFLKYLNTMHLSLGTEIHIQSIESFDKSMKVSYHARDEVFLSSKVCEQLLVKKVK